LDWLRVVFLIDQRGQIVSKSRLFERQPTIHFDMPHFLTAVISWPQPQGTFIYARN
jgi:hypothetical protein